MHRVPLGELIVTFDHLRVPVPTAKRVPGPFPYYGASGVVDHVEDYLFDGNYLLISEDGENLRSRATPIAFLVRGRFWANNHAHVVQGEPGTADTSYLAYALNAIDISGALSGSAQPKLSQASMKRLMVPYRPLAEQRAIAEVLGALDDKIAANDSLVRCAERLMESLVEGLTPTTYLGNIVHLSKKQVSPIGLDEVPVWHYSLPAFDQSRLPSEEPADSILSSKFAIETPSVLLSKLNPRFPRVWNVLCPSEISLASTEFLVLVPQELPTSALWAVLSLARTKAFLVERVSGTSGSHQRVRPQEVLQIPVPGVSQFDAGLLERLDALGETADIHRRESRTLARLRDTLLPPLMDGTLRVKDAVAQVEEVL